MTGLPQKSRLLYQASAAKDLTQSTAVIGTIDSSIHTQNDESEIRQVLLTYGDGLNKASVEQCVGQYSKDGVCMPPNQSASTGTAALNKTYQGFFSMLKFDVKFDIVEAHAITPDWGFARTTSAGTTTLVQTGKENHEANHELFVMKKEGGSWKIARYCFCTTNPPS